MRKLLSILTIVSVATLLAASLQAEGTEKKEAEEVTLQGEIVDLACFAQ